MHFVKAKGLLSAQNGMNIYRGCVHGCIYCDSRSECYHMDHDFEDIEVKKNALELLDEELKSKRQSVMVGTGAMSDPYNPFERELELTRGSLELIYKHGCGATVLTKSIDVTRDMDLLERINGETKAVVQMTLTTFDDELCKKLEPNVSTTAERFNALMQLKESGIPTVVWFTPLLPFINDTEENVRGIMELCAKAGVDKVLFFGMGLTLRQGNREYYYQQLDKLFPGLSNEYNERYGDRYMVESPDAPRLNKVLRECAEKYRINMDNEKIFEYLHAFERRQERNQISLFNK